MELPKKFNVDFGYQQELEEIRNSYGKSGAALASITEALAEYGKRINQLIDCVEELSKEKEDEN